MSTLSCNECGHIHSAKPTVKGNPRLPRGWKKHGNYVFCSHCWKKSYLLRSIVIPVAGPVGCDWSTLREALERCWEQSTSLANWTVTELAKVDFVRMPSDTCLKSMPRVYLYPKARASFPSLSSKTITALLNRVEKSYCKSRLAVIWRSDVSLQRFQYPVAYPVPSQAWKARFGEGSVPIIDLRLGEEPFSLRLRGGHQNRRQLKAFAKIASGQAIRCDVALYRQRASYGDHRSVVEDREPGGGARTCYNVLAKLTAWLPRSEEKPDRDGMLEVHTSSESFLTATSQRHPPWILNADHLKRWVSAHRRKLDRLAQDSKYEKRWPKRSRRQLADFRAALVDRHRRRIDTFCHQASAMLAGYAERRRFATVRYDDSNKSFGEEFPWFRFKELLETKLNERGIGFLIAPIAIEKTASDERKAA